jgi:hypothetical protein
LEFFKYQFGYDVKIFYSNKREDKNPMDQGSRAVLRARSISFHFVVHFVFASVGVRVGMRLFPACHIPSVSWICS